MAGGEELRQDTRQQLNLARAPDELVVDHRAGVNLVLDALEQERVLADLPQLHQLVAQTLDTARFAIARISQRGRRENKMKVHAPFGVFAVRDHLVLLHLLVQLRLQRAHADLDDILDLVRQFGLDVLLETTQQERPQHLVQTTNNKQRLFFVQLDLVACARVRERRVEPFIERLNRVEDFREREVEERPQLGEVILQGCSCKDEPVARVVVLRQSLREFTLGVLHTVTLVCDNVSDTNRELANKDTYR